MTQHAQPMQPARVLRFHATNNIETHATDATDALLMGPCNQSCNQGVQPGSRAPWLRLRTLKKAYAQPEARGAESGTAKREGGVKSLQPSDAVPLLNHASACGSYRVGAMAPTIRSSE
jgi:hypothetical protein